jgi:toxin ParE1/3/4
MTRYIFGRDAAEDLDQIWNYIAQDNVSAADRLIKKLFDAFTELAKIPH